MLEWVAVIGGAIIIAVVVRTFILQTFWIPSPSMSPTLVENDRVLVNKLSYKFHDVNRGDVVVFERPDNEPPSDIKDLIKRVVALPGEHVSIMDGKVSVDGRVLDEPYTHNLETVLDSCPITYVPGIDTKKGFLVPKDHVLVLGDNRVNSHDGRCFGAIDEDLIVGRAFFLMWPPGHAGGL
jgi:signal peptidase I